MEQEPELPGAGSPSSSEGSEPPSLAAPDEVGEAHLSSAFAGAEEERAAVPEHAAGGDDEEMIEAAPLAIAGGKRKRGRPRKNPSGARAPARRKEEEEEEVVCFICFDGGDLIVCDRRGCQKVYHPDCVNRDAAYFRSRDRWNCGWHICSKCEKAAHFMCYTCTYSLCKACNKGDGFVCIRGNKGLCQSCYTTIMLIESNEGSELGVNFNDRSSWDYLFKEYWLALKGKLSITLEELSAAKDAWERSCVVSRNEDSSDESYDANYDQETSSDSFPEHHGGRTSSRKKVKRRSRNAAGSRNTTDAKSSVKQLKKVDSGGAPTAEDTKWASLELLEFVAHMKDGVTSPLSQFDVQALLLEYIKINKLRNPRRKSQIICDLMLQKLFLKDRVGHFEMLKLLESHFLIKEASHVVTDDDQGGVVNPIFGHMDDEEYDEAASNFSSDKSRKNRRRVDERQPQTNFDDYAAIDVHNINLIYLRRSLMEDLIDYINKFNEKVVGSFVRIRIPVTGQKQDLYRLVQVVGSSEGAERYKIGKKTTNMKLEILNLDKTEAITIDTISNQEFTEEECGRLRQSIKCGLINRLTVGQVQEKASVLQAVRVDDWLECEKLRLGHLRDRASEKGRRKELRECVEKLQLLSMPEERWRRINEVPEIHADPKMDPTYESADEEESDDINQDFHCRSRGSFSLRKGWEVLSSGGLAPSNNWKSGHKSLITNGKPNSTVAEGAQDKVDAFSSAGNQTHESLWAQVNGAFHSIQGALNAQPNTTDMEAGGWNNHQHAAMPDQSYGVALETTSPRCIGISVPSTSSEIRTIWHYQDPSGKVQGPFSMTQLHKWSMTGYFPPDLRIWRAYEKQDDSISLTDALIGKLKKDMPQWEPQHNSFHQPTQFGTAMDIRENKEESRWVGNINNPEWVDGNQNRGNWSAGWNDATFSSSGNTELANADRQPNRSSAWSAGRNNATFSSVRNTEPANADKWANQSSDWSAPRTEVANSMEGKIGSRSWETSWDVNAWSCQPQAHSSLRPTAPFSGNNYQPPPYQGKGSRGRNAGRWNRCHNREDSWSLNRPKELRPNCQGYEGLQSHFDPSSQQSSGEFWNAQPANVSRNQWGNDPFNPPTPTGQPGRGGWADGQGVVNQSAALPTASQPMGSGLDSSASTRSNVAHQSPFGTLEPSKAAVTANSVGHWGSTSASNVLKQTDKTDGWDSWCVTSPSMPDKTKKADDWGSNSACTLLKQTGKSDRWDSWSSVSTSLPDKATIAEAANSSQIPERSDGLGDHVAFKQQKKLSEFDALALKENQSSLPMDRVNLSVSALVMSGSGTDELRGPVSKHQFLQGDCPSPTPLCERQELLIVQCNKLDSASAVTAIGKSDPPARPFPEVDDNLQPASSVTAEDMADKGLVKYSEAQKRPSPLHVMEVKLISPTSITSPTVDSDSARRPEVSSGSKLVSESQYVDSASYRKGGQRSSSSNSPSGRWEHYQTQQPLDTKGNQWSLPSPTPSMEPSGWDLSVDSTSGKDQSNLWVSSNGSKPPLSQSKSGSSAEPAQSSTPDWGSRANDVQGGWDQLLAPQNHNRGTGTGPGDTNTGWLAQVNTDSNTGWGAAAQRGWETPAPGTANAAGTGWGAPMPGSMDANTCIVAPSYGSMNPNAGWVAPGHGNACNPSWGVPAQGHLNSHPGLGSTNQNPNREAPTLQGSTNANGGWGTHQSTNYGPQNSRMHSGGGGWSSQQGQGQRGVCKFHESGYCKKGSRCNFLHI